MRWRGASGGRATEGESRVKLDVVAGYEGKVASGVVNPTVGRKPVLPPRRHVSSPIGLESHVVADPERSVAGILATVSVSAAYQGAGTLAPGLLASIPRPLHLPSDEMNTTQGLDAGTGVSRNGGDRRPTLREVELRAVAILLLTGGCVLAIATLRSSPIRAVLSLSFLLFGPGLALAELLDIRDPTQRVAIATAASLSIETLVAMALVLARAFSLRLAIGIIVALTVSAVGVAVLRARRSGVLPHDRYPRRA
jgi:hypothetical protein